MDKVREEFEMWLNTKGISFDFSVYLNKYTDKKIQNRYEAWKASREYIVVKLPEKQDEKVCLFDFQRAYAQGYNHGIDACAKQLIEEGIKYE